MTQTVHASKSEDLQQDVHSGIVLYLHITATLRCSYIIMPDMLEPIRGSGSSDLVHGIRQAT